MLRVYDTENIFYLYISLYPFPCFLVCQQFVKMHLAIGYQRRNGRHEWFTNYLPLCTSLRDLDLVTSHTPEKTSTTARAWVGFNTPIPINRVAATDTMGCT